MKKWFRFSVLVGVFVLAFSLVGCGKKENAGEKTENTADGKTTITLGYLPITHALAMFEAKELLEKNADSNVTVELKKFGTWPDLMDALNAGQIDGASVLVELAMGAKSQGIDLKAVALGHKDGNVIVVSNNIEKVSDLKGKTFAIPSNQSSHNILVQDMLERENLSINDLNIVQLAPVEMASSLTSGSIDGYCVAEPFGTQSVINGAGHVLFDSKELWQDSICCALVFHGDFLKNKEAAAKEFMDTYYEAGKALNIDEAYRIATTYLGQSEEVLKASVECISFDDLELKEEDYKVLEEKVVKYAINENPPTFEDFVYQFK